MRGLFFKLTHDPIGFFGRAIYKTLIGPLKYGKSGGYDAARYWRDRFTKYGTALKGVGDEGLSEQENRDMYERAAQVFLELCRREKIDFASARVLEIGCGSGFYTKLLQQQGVTRYLGVDITDALFPELVRCFPGFHFVRRDVTEDAIDGEFDLILMIDVIEHIVDDDRLGFALANAASCLAKNGRFWVAPVAAMEKRSLFYVRFWSGDVIRRHLPRCVFGEPVPFRGGHLLTATRSHSDMA